MDALTQIILDQEKRNLADWDEWPARWRFIWRFGNRPGVYPLLEKIASIEGRRCWDRN